LGLNKDQVVVVKNAGFLSRADRDSFIIRRDCKFGGSKKSAESDGVVGGQNWTNGMRCERVDRNSQLMNFLSVSYVF
jgi:hypothetical protein